jgi:hypothetical protein
MMMTRTKAAAPNRTTTANRPLSENPTKTNKAKAKLGSLQVDLERPRLIRMAPNGDIFIAESFAGCIRVLRPTESGDAVLHNSIHASGLRLPFGIVFSNAAKRREGAGSKNLLVDIRIAIRPVILWGTEEEWRIAFEQGGHTTRCKSQTCRTLLPKGELSSN